MLSGSHFSASVDKMGRRRWRIAALLSAGVLVSYIDRVNLSVAHDALTSGFQISKGTFGVLLSAYNFTYCLCQLPMGVILDRFGVRRVGRISTFLWSVASFAAAAAGSGRRQLDGIFRGTFSSGSWRVANLPRELKGYRKLVPGEGAQPGDGDV